MKFNKSRNARPREPWPGLSLLRSASPFAWRYVVKMWEH